MGVATLATRPARAGAEDDVEKIVEGFCEDGSTIQPGPLHERSRLEEMRARLLAAHQRNPEDDATTIKLAVFEARTGHHDRALQLLSEVAAVSTHRALALYDAGLIKMRLGRLADARDTLADAAAVGSDRAEPALALAVVHERLGDLAAAAQALESAEKRTSGAAAATCALRAGALHERAGALEEAAAAFGRAATLAPVPTPGVVPALGAPTSARGHAERARILLRLGRAADAVPALEKALEDREDGELRFKHGLALFLSGKPAEEDIVRLEKSNPELARRLAEIVARKRDVK